MIIFIILMTFVLAYVFLLKTEYTDFFRVVSRVPRGHGGVGDLTTVPFLLWVRDVHKDKWIQFKTYVKSASK